MSVGALIAILVALVILAVLVALASRMAVRRSAERRNLGPEYNRLADELGTSKANAEIAKRRRRVDGLDIKPLSPEQRTAYNTQWEAAQDAFIDSPVEAVRTAATLVTAVAADRGYDVADSDQLLVDLSVHHGNQLDGYRSALAVAEAADDTVTETLRQALLNFRAMFCELAEIRVGDETNAATTRGGLRARHIRDHRAAAAGPSSSRSLPRQRSS